MIKVVFNEGSDYIVAVGLFQWDYGQELHVYGIRNDGDIEVHFSINDKRALVVKGIYDTDHIVAQIPDKLLTKGTEIMAHVYVENGISGKTIKSIKLPVKSRAKPEDYIDEENPGIINELIKRIDAKADDLKLDDNVLQLYSGDVPVGAPVALPSSVTGEIDYDQTKNKPRINDVELSGNKTASELHLQEEMHELTDQEIDEILMGGILNGKELFR